MSRDGNQLRLEKSKTFREFQKQMLIERTRKPSQGTPPKNRSPYVMAEDYERTNQALKDSLKLANEEIDSLKTLTRNLKLPTMIGAPMQRTLDIPVSVDQGGTGAVTAAQARANLGITSTGSATDTIYIGEETADGSWRLTKSGNNLSVQRRESGSWVEKGYFLP